jgi:hypothetical protein
MAMICDDLGLLFLCVHKTGSTSIITSLKENFKGRWIPSRPWTNFLGTNIVVDNVHTSMRQLILHKIILPDELARLKVAAFTRNPFDHVVSFYLHRKSMHIKNEGVFEKKGVLDKMAFLMKKKKHDGYKGWQDGIRILDNCDLWKEAAEISFDDFVDKYYKDKKKSVVEYYVMNNEVKVEIFRFEGLNNEFRRMMKWAGVDDPPQLPHMNATALKTKHYREYYNDKTRKIVEKAFEGDIKRFGYTF